MSDKPTLFGATGKPIDAAAKAEGRVQPGPSATPAGPKNRYRSFVVMMPNGIAERIVQEHQHIASFGRAPESFGDYLMVLMMQGRQVFVPHQLAEIEAEAGERMAADVKWAQEVIADESGERKFSDEDRKRAHEIMAAVEMARQEVEAGEEAEKSSGDTASGEPRPALAQATPAPAVPKSYEAEQKKDDDGHVDLVSEAAQKRREDAAGRLALMKALEETPEGGAPCPACVEGLPAGPTHTCSGFAVKQS